MHFGKSGSADGPDRYASRRLAIENLEPRAVPASLVDLITIGIGETTLGEGWRPHSGSATYAFRLATTPTAPVTVTLVADDSRLGYQHWDNWGNNSNSFILSSTSQLKRIQPFAADDAEVTGTVAASVDVVLSSADPRFNGVLDDRFGLTITDNDFLVTSIADSGPGSLRQAISDAQNGTNLQTIKFAESLSGQTIRLKSALTSSKNLLIDASNLPGGLTFTPDESTPRSRFFELTAELTLKNLTIRGFQSQADGGAIRASGSRLEIHDSVFEGNEANQGGAISIVSGSAFISNTRFGGSTDAARNRSICEGGALYVGTSASATVLNSNFSKNVANTDGGAVWNAGVLFAYNSNIVGNLAGGTGGGITNRGRLRLTGSTLSENSSETGGGAHLAWGEAFVVNSTISGNSAQIQGGGIRIAGGFAEIISSTIAGNLGTVRGGGISTLDGATASLRNSIVAGNVAGSAAARTASDLAGVAPATNYSLIADPASALNVQHGQNGNIVGRADATGGRESLPMEEVLFPLANNGGLTRTHALRPTSPAIDQGLISPLPYPPMTVLPTDQRGTGHARIIGESIDMGAIEFQQWQNVESPTDVNDDNHITAQDALNIINELNLRRYSNPQSGALAPMSVNGETQFYYDVNDDGYVTAVDALLVINQLHRMAGGSANGLSAGIPQAGEAAEGETVRAKQIVGTSAKGPSDDPESVPEPSADDIAAAHWFVPRTGRESKKTPVWPMQSDSDNSL